MGRPRAVARPPRRRPVRHRDEAERAEATRVRRFAGWRALPLDGGHVGHHLAKARERLNALRRTAAAELRAVPPPDTRPLPGPADGRDWLAWFWSAGDAAEQGPRRHPEDDPRTGRVPLRLGHSREQWTPPVEGDPSVTEAPRSRKEPILRMRPPPGARPPPALEDHPTSASQPPPRRAVGGPARPRRRTFRGVGRAARRPSSSAG